MVRADMDDEMVTGIVTSIWESRDFLMDSYAGFQSSMEPEFIKGMNEVYSKWLHPAAKTYWEEQIP